MPLSAVVSDGCAQVLLPAPTGLLALHGGEYRRYCVLLQISKPLFCHFEKKVKLRPSHSLRHFRLFNTNAENVGIFIVNTNVGIYIAIASLLPVGIALRSPME